MLPPSNPYYPSYRPHRSHRAHHSYSTDTRDRDRDTDTDRHSSSHRLPPPPPPAVASASVASGGLSGFQVDYTRVDTSRPIRRPRVVWDDDKAGGVRPGEDGPQFVGQVKPPPPEAYVLLRPHRRPRNPEVWDDGVETEMPVVENWSFSLDIIQHPLRGKALGLQALPRGWPSLSSPLIIQLIVKDADGNILPPDNPALSRRLVHTVMVVELVSTDHKELRSVMRVRTHTGKLSSPLALRYHTTDEYGTVDYPHASWVGYHKNLLGSTVRSSTTLSRGAEKGVYFLFSELIVRNTGTYSLRVKLVDIAGPPHVGTSIGVTPVLVTDHTPPFQVYHATKYPGSMPVTDLSLEFTHQGERNLGRDKRKTRDDRGISSDEEASPERQTGVM